jgi:hypothetical protein
MMDSSIERRKEDGAKRQFLLTGFTQTAGIRIYAFEGRIDAKRIDYMVGHILRLSSLAHGYRGSLPPGKYGSQKAEFRIHFGGVGHSLRDFLAKEFAIPLAKPVNGDLERSL